MPDCCSAPDPQWRFHRDGEQFTEVLECAHCGATHRTEVFLIPVFFPGPGRCMNCGGALEPDTLVDGDPTPRGFECERCGLHDTEALGQHQRLAERIAPDASFVEAALQAAEQGRHVVALKLATAHIRHDAASLEARALRLQELEILGYGESAAREAWRWAQSDDAPDVAWTILADLEAATGNIEGALRALQRALRRSPDDAHLWIEYAELLLHADERQTALDAARHVLTERELRPRALTVITAVADRYAQEEQSDQVDTAFAAAGDFALDHAPLLFARAQAAAQREDLDEALLWLERTLEHDPAHAAAREAKKRLQPPQKKKWLFW